MNKIKFDISFSNKLITIKPLDFNNLNDFEWMLESSNWEYHSLSINTKEDLIRYFKNVEKEKYESKSIPFNVILNETGESIAFSRFINISYKNKKLEIGGCIKKEFRKKGINQLIKLELLEYTFNELKFNRVEMFVNFKNECSMNSLNSMNIHKEGVLRNYSITEEGKKRDLVLFSIIPKEWREIKFLIIKNFNL